MIPYGKQQISQDDIDSVVNVLKSDWLTQGPMVPKFEDALANYCEAKHAVAVNSATSALHIACLALELGEGDIAWTTPISFVASANCALYCGACVDFVDIDLATGNMSALSLEKKLVAAKKSNSLPKVVIPVHLAGQPCDMRAIKKLADEYNFYLIEDASHAIGAKYKEQKVGVCQYSDITIFSFHPVKIITSAEGGMALTNNIELAKRMQLFRSHGITSTPEEMTEPSHGPWYYQQVALGFNYRMTDIQAALGLSQMKRLNDFVEKRNQLANIYDIAFTQDDFSPLKQSTQCYSSYHLYIIQLNNSSAEGHKQVITQLRAAGIMAHVHYIPIHLQPFYAQLGFKKGDYPQAEQYYHSAISLPLYPELSHEDQQYIIKKVRELT